MATYSDMASLVASGSNRGNFSNEYANLLEMQRIAADNKQRYLDNNCNNNGDNAEEELFFQHKNTTLEATVDLFHELFPHLASKLSLRDCISYWNELGIDLSTIHSTLHHLGIVDESDNAVHALFQRFAEALTGICLAHPCSTVIFLTAFDELKSAHSDSAEQRHQVESELAESRRRIALLADEADERCRQAEAISAEKLSSCQKNNSSVIAQIRSELEAERNSWLVEREGLVNDLRLKAEALAKWQKKFDEEVAECTYWKEQVQLLREDVNSIGHCGSSARSSRLRSKKPSSRTDGSVYSGDSCSETDSSTSSPSSASNESGGSSTKVMSVPEKCDLRAQLDTQIAVNKVLTTEIGRLEELLANSAPKQNEPTVCREDSGLGMAVSSNNNNNNGGNQTSNANNQTDGTVTCFDLLYGSEEQQSPCCGAVWANCEFEALEAACFASPSLVDAETQCSVPVKVTSHKQCQANFAEVSEADCKRLTAAVSALETNLSESVAAFNSLRFRYHKQLVRTNQLIDLTNELYAENCRLTSLFTSSPSSSLSMRRHHQQNNQQQQLPLSSRSSSSFVSNNESNNCNCCHDEMEGKPTTPSQSAMKANKSKRKQKEEIYVVVGRPNLAHPLQLNGTY